MKTKRRLNLTADYNDYNFTRYDGTNLFVNIGDSLSQAL